MVGDGSLSHSARSLLTPHRPEVLQPPESLRARDALQHSELHSAAAVGHVNIKSPKSPVLWEGRSLSREEEEEPSIMKGLVT